SPMPRLPPVMNRVFPFRVDIVFPRTETERVLADQTNRRGGFCNYLCRRSWLCTVSIVIC
ncbi:MAG: hypothetical protein R3174_11970, partial [Gammaproteobacteria bacterium]|nr:hypothetical protein [Gammaproteobacteria bacterium]